MRRQPCLCPRSPEEDGVPGSALHRFLNSFHPEKTQETADIPVPHGAKGWGKLTLPASHSIRLLPYQWVTVTMETNKFLHITGEPASQEPRALGEAEGGLQQKGSAPFTEYCGELMETD